MKYNFSNWRTTLQCCFYLFYRHRFWKEKKIENQVSCPRMLSAIFSRETWKTTSQNGSLSSERDSNASIISSFFFTYVDREDRHTETQLICQRVLAAMAFLSRRTWTTTATWHRLVATSTWMLVLCKVSIEKTDIKKVNDLAHECFPQTFFFQQEHEVRLRHGIVSSRRTHQCCFVVMCWSRR